MRFTEHPSHRTIRRCMGVAAAAATCIVALLMATGTALAATTFTGGPDADGCPLYVPNDHTAFAVKWSATGGTLTPGAQYYVKMRFNTSAGTGGSALRGWTWSGAQWVQERDDWTKFPIVTADGSGNLPSTWTFCKFGDQTKSGTYYVVISLTPLPYASGQVQNATVMPAVTVVDMATGGFWVHNGVATGAQATKRAEATDDADAARVWALSRTEINTVDDDSNGTVDDEDYGPAGKTGDFRFALPVASVFDVFLNRVAWSPGANTSGTLADVDIAQGAADTTAPAVVTGLTAAPKNAGVDLSWAAATDNVGVTAYNVYRWTDPVAIGGSTYYTSLHAKVATVAAATTFADSGLTNGTTYYYEVRAVDAATNVGPRSDTVIVKPDAIAPTTTDDSNGWAGTSTLITFTATDTVGGSGVDHTEYRIDDETEWTAGTSVLVEAPADHSWDGTTHTVTYRSVDKAGNVESPVVRSLVIDTTAPLATGDDHDDFWHGSLFLHFTGSDDRSGVVHYLYRVDGGLWQRGNCAWFAGRRHKIDRSGTHTVDYRAVDAAGNVSSGSGACIVHIDSLAPVTEWDAPAAATAPVTIHLTADDAHSGVATTEYSTDGGASWTTGTEFTLETAGTIAIAARSIDNVGNVETARRATVLVTGGSSVKARTKTLGAQWGSIAGRRR
jgi:hypothetical protein